VGNSLLKVSFEAILTTTDAVISTCYFEFKRPIGSKDFFDVLFTEQVPNQAD
jgi:hypothetical protein